MADAAPPDPDPGTTGGRAAVVADPEALLPAALLGRLAELSTAELRERREACELAEEAVSYARRLLQGRLDLLRAELAGRDSDDAADLLASLPTILSSDQGSASDPLKARSVRLRVPADAEAYEAAIDAILAERAVDEADVDELARLTRQLTDYERELSSVRRALFDRIDALRDELAARYKDGRADVSELLR